MKELIKVNEVYLCIKLLHTPTLRPTLALLYTPTVRSKDNNLRNLTRILKHHDDASKLSMRLARQIMKEMINRNRTQRICKDMRNEIVLRLAWGMTPLLLTLGHFFNEYKKEKVADKILPHDKAVQRRILDKYPEDLLLAAHQMHHLLMHLMWRRFTPARKWWRKTPIRPSERSMINILAFGSIAAITQLYEVRKKSKRPRAFMERAALCAETGKGLLSSNTRPSGEEEDDLTWYENMPKAVMNIWSQPAEKLLISKKIVQNLTEISCCGKFISSILINSLEDDKKKAAIGDRKDEEISADEVAAARKEVVGEQLSWSRWDGDVDHWDGWSIFGGNESDDDDDNYDEEEEDSDEEKDPSVDEYEFPARSQISCGPSGCSTREFVRGGSSEMAAKGALKKHQLPQQV